MSEASALSYQFLVQRIIRVVSENTPLGSTVLVVSKGDPDLIKFEGRIGWHFPGNAPDKYPGYHPACSTAATAHLEAGRVQGAEYLVVPSLSLWWFDHYPAFRLHLDKRYRLKLDLQDTCRLYALREPPEHGVGSSLVQLEQILTRFELRFGREPAILDWNSGLGLARLSLPATVFSPEENGGLLPYLDHSVDIVATASEHGPEASEARRVAKAAVLRPAGKNGRALAVEWIAGPPSARKNSVSVIIPCHNGREVTEACLESLVTTLPGSCRTEIIVVDDASGDGTAAALKHWAAKDSRIRVLRNRSNCGFVESCNRGARHTTGAVLVFLNNDVLLLPGWLLPLLRVFRNDPLAGAVGGKLILPEGTIQEAGGVVFTDGSALNLGRGDTDLEDPLYSFLREVDYCSAALLATPRELFLKLGGFDLLYRPGYYEDTDYCFKLRAHGYRVLFQPETVAVHREGASAGTDLSYGMKRYQVINQKKFTERWKEVLAHQPVKPGRWDKGSAQELVLGRGREIPEVPC